MKKTENQKKPLNLSKNKNPEVVLEGLRTSRRCSLPTDFNRPASPYFSPRTPQFDSNSPLTPNHLTFNAFSPTLDNFEETGEILNRLSKKGKSSSDNLMKKLLDQKEREIKRLEAQKEQWLAEKQEWEQETVKHQQLQANLVQKDKKIAELNAELKETGDDLLQLDKKNDKLNNFLTQEKLNIRQLEEQLAREVDENHRLKASQEEINNSLLAKVKELAEVKKIGLEEQERWQGIITEQQEKYEQEKEEREKQFAQTVNNLRNFQLNTDTSPALGRRKSQHKKTFSTSSLPVSQNNSPRGSFYEKEKPTNLFMEITKGNIFNREITKSPSNLANDSDTDYSDSSVPEKKKKRHSDSPLFNNSLPNKDHTQSFEDLLNIVDNFTTETVEEKENNQELLIKLEELEKEHANLKENHRKLIGDHTTNERLLQEFNHQSILWEEERKKYEKSLQETNQEKLTEQNKQQQLIEELAEVKYKLAEANSKAKLVEKELKDELTQKEASEEDLNELERAIDKSDKTIQRGQQIFSDFKAQILDINNKIIKK
ncbi:hypothetical protein [endosymbiont GvMRE of Glomus versiforme]|uniref:hypothetical protein n=1 Tax=endosymbiont GvMRE of Glomus versiforme TaxID=2039283 RepID=UPI000EC59927|nr:hypothetical protein [endosymbiont GvMRE of Glomus versiforme]RHZ37034.1 hypothetical protein GvMRE_I2g84 [endosymbiont GvMRE of Glomus versiforme]